MPEKRRIEYGVKDIYYVPIEEGAGGVMTFGTPVELIGGKSFELEESVEDTNIHADDRVHITIPGTAVIEGTLTMLQLPESYYKTALGFKIEPNGMLVNTGVRKRHALMLTVTQLDGDTLEETPMLIICYSALAKRPKIASTTKEEETEANEIEIPYTFQSSDLALDSDGKEVGIGKLVKTATNKALFEKFKEAIILPTTPTT